MSDSNARPGDGEQQETLDNEPMEVMWARERDMPVALWIRDGTAVDEVVTAISLSDRSKTEQQTIKRMAGEQS
jgi:hypothetical protein